MERTDIAEAKHKHTEQQRFVAYVRKGARSRSNAARRYRVCPLSEPVVGPVGCTFSHTPTLGGASDGRPRAGRQREDGMEK